jgi:putative ABC transport system substrate-binding protein
MSSVGPFVAHFSRSKMVGWRVVGAYSSRRRELVTLIGGAISTWSILARAQPAIAGTIVLPCLLGVRMKRRQFIAVFGGAAATMPLAAFAQRQSPLVGFLNSASPDSYRFNADSFREGLAKAGFVEGRNVRIEERWARGDYSALPRLAAELVSMGVVAIAATGDVASARAAQLASSAVPVVFTIGGDPIRHGLIETMNRPGRHVTGILFNQNVLGAKRVEFLREIAPKVSRIALLMNPTNPNVKVEEADSEMGAKKLGLETITVNARNAAELETAFEQLLSAKAEALITGTDPILLDRREAIASFGLKHKILAMGFVQQIAAAGGLLSYGPSISWMYRQAGDYIGQILKGADPAEMPVLQPTHFELVINLKTANALGLTVPPTLLARADQVIE